MEEAAFAFMHGSDDQAEGCLMLNISTTTLHEVASALGLSYDAWARSHRFEVLPSAYCQLPSRLMSGVIRKRKVIAMHRHTDRTHLAGSAILPSVALYVHMFGFRLCCKLLLWVHRLVFDTSLEASTQSCTSSRLNERMRDCLQSQIGMCLCMALLGFVISHFLSFYLIFFCYPATCAAMAGSECHECCSTIL